MGQTFFIRFPKSNRITEQEIEYKLYSMTDGWIYIHYEKAFCEVRKMTDRQGFICEILCKLLNLCNLEKDRENNN